MKTMQPTIDHRLSTIDHQSEWLISEDRVRQSETSPEVKARIREYLQKLGFQITEGANLRGNSGIKHAFDMLAQRYDGFAGYTVAVCIAAGGDMETEAGTIFDFANKAYDVGIPTRILVAIPEFGQEAKELAEKQRVSIIGAKRLESLLSMESSQPVNLKEPIRFETREQLLESLTNLGYSAYEKARVQGKSEVEYDFDIFAFIEIDQVILSLGIDFLSGEQEIDLGEVSLFDDKAYDAGIDNKVIVVSPGLTSRARQFAQHKHIKVFESKQEPVSESAVTGEMPARPEEKPTKSGKPQSKLLRQMPQREALQLIPETMARRYNAIPLAISGSTLEVAMADATDIFALEALAAQSRMRIKSITASLVEVREAIDFNYKAYSEIEKHMSRVSVSDETTDDGPILGAVADAPLVQALDLIIEEGVKARSSDIHIEPEDNRLRVRYRIDGTLQDMVSLPLNTHRALISRLKILAELNIADSLRPQDGQFSLTNKGRSIDVRVAIAPTVSGEMAVLRILDKSMTTRGLSELGLLPDSLVRLETMLKIPYGMILVSGPTGAGKTTTLYAAINSLDSVGNNIITIEDPAEYRFEGINQIQVNNQAGVTFAAGLRSILRLDPDIVMVGEIRDAETANIAVQAGLTGHLMLSSIHANDSVGVLFRLADLGVEPFLIAPSVIGVIAQRMVRRICPDCCRLTEAPVVERMAYEKEMGEERTEFMYGAGCKSCVYTGYIGRIGLYEILVMSDTIRELVIHQAASGAIRAQAVKEGMTSMMNDGMRKVKEGSTTPSEVLRSAYSPDWQL